MKKYVLLLFFILLFTLQSSEAKTVQYRTDKTTDAPIYYGDAINVIKDHNGYNFSVRSDGLYKLDYNGNTTYFGFGISGMVNSNPFVRLSTDFGWGYSIDSITDGYSVTSTNTNNNWKTVFNFTPEDTKITNTLTNTLANPITNATFYYVFSINSGDEIEYNKTKYTVPSNPNIRIRNISGNLNNNIPKIVINGNLLFDFRDIIDNGFNITDVYLIPASGLGFSSSNKVVAIGFTKGNSIVPSGVTITIDPTISQDITVTEDTIAEDDTPNTNYGTENQLMTFWQTSPSTIIQYSYIKSTINLPANTTSIINGSLCLYSTSGRTDNQIHNVTSVWTELGLTWNNKPSIDVQVIGTIDASSDGWKCTIITPTIDAWWRGTLTNNGVAIFLPSSISIQSHFYSREGANPGYFKIWYITNDQPTVPVLTSHSNYHNTGTTTVSWSASTDPDGDSINYRIKVGTSSGASNVLNETVAGTSSSSFSITPTNTYYWSVYALDSNGGSSGWATESSFTFTNSIPTMPNISFPLNNSRQYNNSINSTWNISSDGNSDTMTYDHWISTQSDFGFTVNRTNFSSNWTGNIAVTEGLTYYLKVEACDSYSCSPWSPTVQFTENTAPTTDNISLLPLNATTTSNLTVSLNYSDDNGDSITKHYLWYKNGVLQGAWNDTTYRNYSGNYTLNDQIYVRGYVSDPYENSSEVQSNTVIIGSGNSAPVLSGISLNPNNKKYNKTIVVSTSANITDAESSSVQLQVYRYVNGNKSYLGNSSWVAPPNNASATATIPWSDGLAHTIYAQAEDNGNALGQNNLTSSEVTIEFTSNITSPIVNSSSVSPSSVTTGDSVTITITADGIGANISSANVTVTRPDYTSVTLNLTCTYTSGDISTCTRSYTANSGTGTYNIDSFGLEDDSNNTATRSSILTFEATAASSGSPSGGGGGSTTIIIEENEDNATAPSPILTLKNITTGATEPQLQEIADCLTQSLLMPNKCSAYNYGVIVEPMNWWVFTGAFFASFVVVVVKGIKQDKTREWFTEPLLYGTTTSIILVFFVAAGFNMYLFNYLTNSSLYAWTFISTALWGGIVALAWDEYYY